VMPTRMYADSHGPGVLAASRVTTLASTSAITGATIDVVAVDEVRVGHGPMRIVQTEPRARRLSRTISAAELLAHHA
jgi:hypothetical protein